MSQDQNVQNEENTTTEEKKEKEVRVFLTLEEAKENPPQSTERRDTSKWKLFEVFVPPTEGGTFYVHSGGSGTAENQVTGHLGWVSRLAESSRSRGKPSLMELKKYMSELSDEDRAEVLGKKKKKVQQEQSN